ncbi:MAG: TonB-dependent receptor plug domain-containing protein [Muribaculaceae bacterium]
MAYKSLLSFTVVFLVLGVMPFAAAAQNGVESPDSTNIVLDGVVVSASNGTRSKYLVSNTDLIGQVQLRRAACCNLGESFTTNPSVDVSYSDAATGAKQIKLLGLGGTYVQMLTENVPNLRGASIPFSLGYVPGPWMQSIQVSKGAASVKNGYESTTGQINIEFLKPQGTDGVRGNAYLDSKLRVEANLDGSVHINDLLSTSLLLHYEDRQSTHDANHDGFIDMPKLRQINLMHRWAYVSDGFISQLMVRYLNDSRLSGMSTHHDGVGDVPRYTVDLDVDRLEGQWKNALMFDDGHNSSLALMLHGSWHKANNLFGATRYDVTQRNGYAQLMYERDVNEWGNISVGASINHDYYDERFAGDKIAFAGGEDKETTSGVYAQYTFKHGDKLTVMPGLRWDYSSVYGGFVTPRIHVKYSPASALTLRASAGKGYRSPHALAENVWMLASGRTFFSESNLRQEEAWNMGLSASLNMPLAGRNLELNAEYYYTKFHNQLIVNVDGAKGSNTVWFENLAGKSYSHTFQVDATYELFEGMSATAAFRYNDERSTYDGVLRRRPLTSRYKGLLTLSYKTAMDIWQFDLTGQMNGKGEMYDGTAYPTYFGLQAQITREFRLFSLYLGGENLTNYRMKNPVINAANPWSNSFDATQIWGPMDGAMAYVGIRIKFERF